MAVAEKDKWSNITEAGFISGMRFLLWIYRNIGAWAFSLVSWPVVFYYFLTKRIARASSREFINRAYESGAAGITGPPGWRDELSHVRQFAQSTIDKFGAWVDASLLDNVTFPDRQLLLEQLNKGEGAVLLGGHLGNLEVCRSLSRATPQLKLNILVHTRNADKFNKLLKELHIHRELELVEVSELTPATAIRLSDCVMRGEFVAIMADRIPVASEGRTQRVDFLGRDMEFPVGPYILASLLKCPVFTLFCTNTGEGYRVSCRKFSEQIVLPRHRKNEALAKYTQRYAKILEQEALGAPFQWFNFYPFWEQ